MFHLILVASGGFFGAILRFYISNKAHKHFIGTWIANITGSLLLAISFRLYHGDIISEGIWLFSGVGFCGAYTTFSTFGSETIQLILDQKFRTAIFYVLSSFLISLGLVYIVVQI